jgi:hypothetical protein
MEHFLDDDDDDGDEKKSTLIVPSSLDIASKIFFENIFVDLREEKRLKSAMKEFEKSLRFKQSQVLILQTGLIEFRVSGDLGDAYVSLYISIVSDSNF